MNWKTVACNGQPNPRHENGFAQCNGRLYLFGGRRIQPVNVLDPTTLCWQSLAPPPMEIHHLQPVTVGNKIWLLGTMTGQWPEETPIKNALIYNPYADTWTDGPLIPENRRRGAASCTLYDDTWIYMVGGIVDGHRSGTQPWCDRLNTMTGEWQMLPDAPHKRDHAACAIVGSKLYMVGGRETGRHNGCDYDSVFTSTISDIDVFDLNDECWSTDSLSLSVGTAAGGLAVMGDKIYYVGGESGQSDAHSEVQIMDVKKGTCVQGPSLNRGRHGTNCCVLNNQIWIASGSGSKGGSPELASVECLDINM